MSFYSADALPRAVTDLEGVLCAGGVMTLFGRGTAARLAIVLGAPPPVPDEPAAPEPASPPTDHQAPGGPRQPGRAPQVPVDHRDGWDEGIDEIPDDELPVRDDGADPGRPVEPDEAPTTPSQPERPAADAPDAPTLAVVTPDPVVEWRAHALCCAFRGRGVPADVERLPDGRPVVRSAYRADLVRLATAWRRSDGSLGVPSDLVLDGPRLRLWVLAAGSRRGRAYTLGLDPHARTTHEPLLTACQRAGLGATLAGDEDEPVVAIVGQRRQRRLAELVGGRPRTLVEGVWPG
ncbi:MAG: hypothetical protein QOE59_4727 [Actinomycetota bacterium]|jgi:hypothetical protein|nr:hypothetical protein [Actinomycetota bacterium]